MPVAMSPRPEPSRLSATSMRLSRVSRRTCAVRGAMGACCIVRGDGSSPGGQGSVVGGQHLRVGGCGGLTAVGAGGVGRLPIGDIRYSPGGNPTNGAAA